jgi:bifunctional oligoribonuclease and PAP phosphatase NrnA
MDQGIREIIEGGSTFLVTTHIDPDGDAVGSAFAMSWALHALEKRVTIYMRDPVPYQYAFLPRPCRITHAVPDNTFDGVFVLDCSDIDRVTDNSGGFGNHGPIISIDHHLTGDNFGAINVRDEKASSTGEILHGLLKSLGIPITLDIAVNIYTAVTTDTGSFRFQNTTPEAFTICREMVSLGVDPSFVASMVFESHPVERFILLGKVLSTLESYDGGRVIIASITDEMYRATGTNREHSDGFVEILKQVKGAEIAILMRELNATRFKVSMRSKGTRDVASLCAAFGGGGHRNAAGCTIDGDAKQVLGRLKEVLGIR